MKTNNTVSAELKPGLGRELGTLLKNNVRDYVMYIALIAIFIFFGIMTKGRFLSPRNLSDLINQTAYVAVLAIGMTLILIVRHIDLSVGYVAGFLGALSAMLLSNGLPVYVVIPVILLGGVVVGLYQGTLVSRVKVPAFVTTLAGMFIFRGLLSMVTASTGTIIVRDETFKALNSGFLPDFMPVENGIHKLTIAIGIIAVVLMVASQLNSRRQLQRYQFKVNSLPIFIGQLVLFSAIIAAFILMLASYKGLPWAAAIVGVVLFIYNFLLNKTRLGRSIYGIGGNPEAAELSGINVRKVTLLVFASMSMLAALSGMLFTSRMASATPQAGLGFELDAIASSYIGGVSVSGGIGKVTNTIIGALVIMSLTNGMNLMGVDISVQYVVKGVIFIIAVAFDVITRGKR